MKTETQLESLSALWDTLPSPLQDHYCNALTQLESKEMAAWKSLDAVKDGNIPADGHLSFRTLKGQMKRIYMRKRIKQAMSDLEDWQSKFDPSWYLITRIASSTVDQQLEDVPQNESSERLVQMRQAIKSLAAPANSKSEEPLFKDATLVEDQLYRIPRSNTFASAYADTSRPVLLDRTNYPPDTPMNRVKGYVQDLAGLLRNVDPMGFGLLQCEGVIEWHDQDDKATTQFQFIFGIPEGLSATPTTLRDLLMQGFRQSLSQRVHLAKQLARSVMFVHTAGFVHKNIRPETILIFPERDRSGSDDPSVMGHSFLTGFERVRAAGPLTDKYGDIEWQKNLYRHPARQGVCPEELFIMQHDVYSLGVCLLEVGLWCSFIREGADGDGDCMQVQVPWDDLDIPAALEDKDRRRGASAIKRVLVELAKDRLPSLVGELYTSLTVACLTCLDQGDDNTFGSQKELRDKDGIIVGVRYIEKVGLIKEVWESILVANGCRYCSGSKTSRYRQEACRLTLIDFSDNRRA